MRWPWLAALIGCGGEPVVVVTTPPPDESGFSLAAQRVGRPADGLVLRSIRHAPHTGYHRVVFDLGLAEGRLARAAPAATASYRAHDQVIEVVIHGVRDDLTGNLPLRNEAGEPFGKPVPIDVPPIAWYGRAQVLDDSAVAYEVKLRREGRFRLLGLDEPARIVVDVENWGGAVPP
jgi:hypothetical protein